MFNDHLFCSETMRWLIALLSYFQVEPGKAGGHLARACV
jgi:hypothetical protein